MGVCVRRKQQCTKGTRHIVHKPLNQYVSNKVNIE